MKGRTIGQNVELVMRLVNITPTQSPSANIPLLNEGVRKQINTHIIFRDTRGRCNGASALDLASCMRRLHLQIEPTDHPRSMSTSNASRTHSSG